MKEGKICWYGFRTILIGFLLAISLNVHAEQVPAPGFEIPGVDKNISLSDYLAKIVYLDFWAS